MVRADSGTNLINQVEIVTGQPCGSVAQISECLQGLREVLGSSRDRAIRFFLLCDTYAKRSVKWVESNPSLLTWKMKFDRLKEFQTIKKQSVTMCIL